MALWALDLLAATRGLSFAGVSDARAQRRLMEAALPAVMALEGRLLAVHAAGGCLLGLAAGLALRFGEEKTGRRWTHFYAKVSAFVLGIHVLALFGMVSMYPQLYAERWWLRGGALAVLQRTLTHYAAPIVFDALLALLLVLVLLGAAGGAWAAWARRPRWSSRWATTGAAALAVGLGAWMSAGRSQATAPPAARNLLIIAADSLRSDRVESAQVMPFTASLARQGTLYRFAFTPIARTFPSWVSILTGNEPSRHRVRTMFPAPDAVRDVGPTFISELRDAGYHTFVASDFSGDVFPRFNGGFETVDAPSLTVDLMARASVLSAHTWSLPLLRVAAFRNLWPEWRNLPNLADPDWMVDGALRHVGSGRGRPFAGLVFFSTAHFPYAAPYPDYKWGSEGAGRYLYHAPPLQGEAPLSAEDVRQVRARYDGALRSIDRAVERLVRELERRGVLQHTLLILTGDHGEDLYEHAGLAGHGDATASFLAQYVPVLLHGPGVPSAPPSNRQVRLIDLGATALELLGRPPADRRFGQGVSLLAPEATRPLCVQTGMWFWPDRPPFLRGQRLEYEDVSGLLEVDAHTRQMALNPTKEPMVETAKERGVVLGRRFWRQRLTPAGILRETGVVAGIDPTEEDVDLARLFAERCVAEDTELAWLLDAVVFAPARPGAPR